MLHGEAFCCVPKPGGIHELLATSINRADLDLRMTLFSQAGSNSLCDHGMRTKSFVTHNTARACFERMEHSLGKRRRNKWFGCTISTRTLKDKLSTRHAAGMSTLTENPCRSSFRVARPCSRSSVTGAGDRGRAKAWSHSLSAARLLSEVKKLAPKEKSESSLSALADLQPLWVRWNMIFERTLKSLYKPRFSIYFRMVAGPKTVPAPAFGLAHH